MFNRYKPNVLFILFLLTIAGTFLHFLYVQPNLGNLIFRTGSSYYTPGKDKNCTWIVYIKREVRSIPGSFTSAYIGVPELQKHGAITSIFEVVENTLLFSFNMPAGSGKAAPIILSASTIGLAEPAKKITFRWFASTGLTLTLYQNLEACLASAVEG